MFDPLQQKPFLRKLNTRTTDIVVLSICMLAVAINSSIGKPIWVDEFLHFAVGGFSNTPEAWNAIRASIKGINHGQTGIYMLLDYWLLKTFGANLFWLRFPSIVSGLATFLASVYLFRLWKMNFWWQVIGIFSLSSQSTLLYFVGEARPYMPLVAATIGTLAYYSIPVVNRKRVTILLLGWISVLVGVLFHPYFLIYWLFICIFTYTQKLVETDEVFSVSGFLKHCNLPLSFVGSTTFFCLAYATWLQGRPNFKEANMNPFEWVKSEVFVDTFVKISHFQFLDSYSYWFIGLVVVMFFVIILSQRFLSFPWRLSLRLLIAPISLLFTAIGISALLSLISYYQSYWILPRQWVASMALCSIASVWFACRLSKILRRIHILVALIWVIIFVSPILLNTYKTWEMTIGIIQTRVTSQTNNSTSRINPKDIQISSWRSEYAPAAINDAWVELANANIRQGGEVWEIFSAFYGKQVQ